MPGFIRVITGGSPREIGVDIGRATVDIVRELAAANPAFFERQTGRKFGFLRRRVWRDYFPFVRRIFPGYVDELRGLAEGAGIPFEDLFVISAEEEILDTWGGWDKCSSAAVCAPDGLYLLHNEDYIGRYEHRLVLIDAAPQGRPAFLSLSYPGTLAGSSCGLNSAGLAMSGNSLRLRPRRRGLPKNFVLRSLLGAGTLAAAHRLMKVEPRLVGNNAMIVSAAEDRAAYIEAASRQAVLVPLDDAGHLAHTNHILAPRLSRAGESPTASSLRRLAGLDSILAARRGRPTLAFMKRVLSSAEHGLCYHGCGEETPTTLASIIMDPARRRMFVAARGPSGGRYREYRLAGR